MLTFQLIGNIARIDALDSGGIRIAVFTPNDWVVCECPDECLSTRIQQMLRAGDRARLNGRITPRLRTAGQVSRYEVCFIVERAKRLRRARQKPR